MEEYLKEKKISYCKYLEKVYNGDICADNYILGVIAKMWNIQINVISPSYRDVWEVFHDGGDPHIVIISNSHDFGSVDGVSHFTATRGKVKNWQCITPTAGKRAEIGQYKGYKRGLMTAVELFQQIEKQVFIEKAEQFTTELNDMCKIISLLTVSRDKLLSTMEMINMEVDYLKQFKQFEIREIDPNVHPKLGPIIRARDEFLSSPRLQIPKIKVHKTSETCGQSLIQEAECEINEILHEIKSKEQAKVKHLNNDTVEKKQKNQYSDQTNTELESEKPSVTNIDETVFSSEEKQQNTMEEETHLDIIGLDEYSGKVHNEETNFIDQYLLNEKVIPNIQQNIETTEEITFQDTELYSGLELSVANNEEIMVHGIPFEQSAFDMFQSLEPEEQLMEVDIQDIQIDHNYVSSVQLNNTNVVVDQPKLNVDILRVHQDRNSVKKVMQNVVVEQPKVNIKLPTTSSVQAAVQNVVVQQPKVNIKLPARDQHLSSK